MATLGQKPATTHVSFQKQTITGNGGTSYTLQQSVGSELDIAVFINNTRQEPTTAYTASGTSLVMTGAVNSSDSFYVMFLAKAINTTGLPLSAVNTENINASAVTDAKIAGMAASKLTGALPAISGAALTGVDPYPATIDHFVVSHSGAINANTLTYPSGTMSSSNNVTIANSNEITPSVAGRYLVTTNVSAGINSGGGYTPTTYIYKNTSQVAARSGIRNYNGGSTLDFPNLAWIVDVNGTSDYIKVAFHHNSNNATINAGYTVGFRLDQ